jgi:3-oxoacyl-[acyl-carrier-protein] synthase-3
MAFITINDVSILGIASAVPKTVKTNTNDKFIQATGVVEKRISDVNTKTSDLCLAAAEKLISDLKVNKSEIEILVFVSQTPDYKLPVTSTILQHKLGLPQSCICIDIPLGCSGYVYGMNVLSSLLTTSKLSKGLLLVGDTISKEVDPNDSSTEPLFGDAGSATLLEYDLNANPLYFNLGSDGSGFESIIIPPNQTLQLNGIDVFTFGISKVPKVVNEFLTHFNTTINNIDMFVFHQANKMMNNKIYKKLNIPDSKVLSSISKYGNTSSTTIPLTLNFNLDKINKDVTLMFCGFGVGLSWGVMTTTTNKEIYCSEIIEI